GLASRLSTGAGTPCVAPNPGGLSWHRCRRGDPDRGRARPAPAGFCAWLATGFQLVAQRRTRVDRDRPRDLARHRYRATAPTAASAADRAALFRQRRGGRFGRPARGGTRYGAPRGMDGEGSGAQSTWAWYRLRFAAAAGSLHPGAASPVAIRRRRCRRMAVAAPGHRP